MKQSFKDWVNAWATKKNLKKGLMVLVKTYNIETDGPFNDENRGITRKPLDRKYVYVRLCDHLRERDGGDGYVMCQNFEIPGGYMVAAITMRDCLKYKALVEIGYEPIIDLKERRNELKRKVS